MSEPLPWKPGDRAEIHLNGAPHRFTLIVHFGPSDIWKCRADDGEIGMWSESWMRRVSAVDALAEVVDD